jgi:hypothetical protein
LLPVSSFREKFVALQLATFATQSARSGCEQSQQRGSYSITSSARSKKDSGSLRPSALAELRLM